MKGVESRRCTRCKKLQPESLFAESSGLCVYCKAEDADALPKPNTQKINSAEMEPETDSVLSVEEKAKAELALRFLTRKRLLPFVERFNPDYQAGWVHKDICRRLEKFSNSLQIPGFTNNPWLGLDKEIILSLFPSFNTTSNEPEIGIKN